MIFFAIASIVFTRSTKYIHHQLSILTHCSNLSFGTFSRLKSVGQPHAKISNPVSIPCVHFLLLFHSLHPDVNLISIYSSINVCLRRIVLNLSNKILNESPLIIISPDTDLLVSRKLL